MHDVTIPALGMAMTEAVVTQWHKRPGDAVSAGDVIAEIETDKTNVDLASPADGVLGAYLVAEGDTVPVGQPVVRVLGPDETEPGTEPATPEPATSQPAAAQPAAAQSAAAQPAAAQPAQAPGEDASASASTSAPVRTRSTYSPPARAPHALSPRKRRLARLEAEADAFLAVTQEGGPTQAREAREAHQARPAAAATPTVPAATAPVGAGRYRAAIAQRVAESWRTIPHFAVRREIEAGEADSCLALIRESDPDATLTDLLLRAFALAMGAVLPSDGDVGLAVATPDGVMMPVVSAVPELGVSGLVSRRTSAVRRAREGKLAPKDLTSVPVGSLSNLRNVDSFTGIIPLGQQLLLTVGRVAARPVVVDGRLAVRTTVVATLNVDHRHLDGDRAARVLTAFEHELGAVRAWAEGDRK